MELVGMSDNCGINIKNKYIIYECVHLITTDQMVEGDADVADRENPDRVGPTVAQWLHPDPKTNN